jgi:hypothetical protein
LASQIGYDFGVRDAVGTMDRASGYGALYGVLFVVVGHALDRLDWTPLWILFWGYHATMAGTVAFFMWRRLEMPWMMLAGTIASIWFSVNIGLSAVGLRFQDVFVRWPFAYIPILLACPVLVAISHWREADRWKQWHARVGHVRFRDMFLFRHIPDLRAGR